MGGVCAVYCVMLDTGGGGGGGAGGTIGTDGKVLGLAGGADGIGEVCFKHDVLCILASGVHFGKVAIGGGGGAGGAIGVEEQFGRAGDCLEGVPAGLGNLLCFPGFGSGRGSFFGGFLAACCWTPSICLFDMICCKRATCPISVTLLLLLWVLIIPLRTEMPPFIGMYSSSGSSITSSGIVS